MKHRQILQLYAQVGGHPTGMGGVFGNPPIIVLPLTAQRPVGLFPAERGGRSGN